MVAVARKTLVYEWRRFLPAALTVGFTGLLQLLQTAVVLGIFASAGVYVTGSSADLWVGHAGTQSVSLGRSIDPDVETRLLMDPQVDRVEPFVWVDADWRFGTASGGQSVFVCGINPRPGGLMFAHVLPERLRALLQEPGAVIVDRADVEKLGIQVGDRAIVNGRSVHVVGVGTGLRALGGVNVVASLDTAHALVDDPANTGRPTYLIARLRDPAQASAVATRLRDVSMFGPYEVWTARAFARRSILYWMLQTGAGAGVLFMAAGVFLVGTVITSQTLAGAVAGSRREYATLKALGVGTRALGWVVLEQAFWVGTLGLFGTTILGGLLLEVARAQNVPMALDLPVASICALLTLGLVILSGLAALRGLRSADPAELLR
jgi:putative ABC transport system permease protein